MAVGIWFSLLMLLEKNWILMSHFILLMMAIEIFIVILRRGVHHTAGGEG